MTQPTYNTLHNLLKSLSNIDKACTSASTAGAPHVQTVSNALLAFSDVVLQPFVAPISVGQLSTVHSSATESLHWLLTTLTRLAAALRGAQQTEEILKQAASAESTHDADSNLLDENSTYLPIARWSSLVSDINAGLERDLDAKRAVVQALQQAIATGHVQRTELELCVATWLEQPQRTPGVADVLVAAFEAEREAMGDRLSEGLSPEVRKPTSGARNIERTESPALARLRLSGKKKKG